MKTAHLLGLFCLSVLIVFTGFVLASSAGPVPYSLEVMNNSLIPSAELFLRKGESVAFRGTDVPLKVRLRNAMGRVHLPASAKAMQLDADLVFSLYEWGRVVVVFQETGDYEVRLDGLNPGKRADKCGVDVLPHYVEGVIRVRK